MRKNTKYDWIIAVSDSDGTGVELEKITETTDDRTERYTKQ